MLYLKDLQCYKSLLFPLIEIRHNLRPCVKIAVDFVSVENAQFAVDLVDDYRGLKQGHAHKEDVLQARASWRSASATPGRRAVCMCGTHCRAQCTRNEASPLWSKKN